MVLSRSSGLRAPYKDGVGPLARCLRVVQRRLADRRPWIHGPTSCICYTMAPDAVVTCLRAVRRLRRATLEGDAVPPTVRVWLAHGLGDTCNRLARWVDESVSDRRSVDVTIRFYGLDRLPEELSEIGRSLRREAGRGFASPESKRAVSPRQVQNLLRVALDELEIRPFPFPVPEDAVPCIQPVVDPFPGAWRPLIAMRLRALGGHGRRYLMARLGRDRRSSCTSTSTVYDRPPQCPVRELSGNDCGAWRGRCST